MVGKRIKQLRQEHKMTQQDFASLLNLNGSAISLYENGKRMPEYDIIIKIANHFNVTVDWLLGRIEERDLVKLEKDYIPKELLNVGVEYLKLAKEMENKSIPPEDIRKIISAINALKKD
ncbi:MAG: helix-turn-helix transcriptional regulator [Firmicutes bacterium]|nr:helix-turn-helix transcriptional regulator [Bacillota bacterium]